MEAFKGRVLFHTTYSEYFKQNLHMFDQHIPPKRLKISATNHCQKTKKRSTSRPRNEYERGAEMKVIAVIEDPDELGRILGHLVKIGRSSPRFGVNLGLDPRCGVTSQDGFSSDTSRKAGAERYTTSQIQIAGRAFRLVPGRGKKKVAILPWHELLALYQRGRPKCRRTTVGSNHGPS